MFWPTVFQIEWKTSVEPVKWIPARCSLARTGSPQWVLQRLQGVLLHIAVIGLTVVWIVPTLQIYRQTLSRLKDRDDPYRQHLDGGGRAAGQTGARPAPHEVSPDGRENAIVVQQLVQASEHRLELQGQCGDEGEPIANGIRVFSSSGSSS